MASEQQEKEKQFLEEYYGQLVGMTVEKVEVTITDDMGYPEVWPAIFFKKGDLRIKSEISRDPEGNGPGFLFQAPVDENDEVIEEK